MTVEQILAIRSAQSQLEDFKKKNSEELRCFSERHWTEVLGPLTKTCDHLYPWGDSAFVYDPSMPGNYRHCKFCGKWSSN